MSQNFILGPSGPLNYKQVPQAIKSLPAVKAGTSLLKSIPNSVKTNAFAVFPELMNLWYGERNGIKGPGRVGFENTWGPLIKGLTSTPKQREQARQEYIMKYRPRNMLGGGNKPSGSNSNAGVPFEILDDIQLTGGKSVQVNNKSGQPNTQAQALALAQQLGSNPPITNQKDADIQQTNINAINDYISKLQEINKPYIDALQDYSDRYDDLVKNNFNAQRYFTAMAGLTGNNNYARLADSINPLVVEGNKIDLQKKIQDAQAGDLNAINEIMGNLAMAQEMGLPPEAAFANKNLLTMMAARDREANKYQIALENNLMKKYGIDRNYARALTVQAMRGQNALDVASMYTGAYGNGGGVAPGLNQQGTANNVASMDAMLQAAHNKNNR